LIEVTKKDNVMQ